MQPALSPDPMLPLEGKVRRYRSETTDTFTIDIGLKGAADLPFAPGQFNMLYVFGVGEVPISISGDPENPGVVTHTTREVGSVTRVMRRLRPGDTVGVRGPYGTAWPVEEARGHDVVLIAGGIGLAPLRPALYHLLQHRADYGRIVLLYGTRTPEDILFRKEMSQWRSRWDIDVHVTVDRATRRWHGNVGVVTTLIPKIPFSPKDAVAMLCGPEIMMHVTVQELHRRGVPADQVYVSLERNMKCALGLCGHCQYGPVFICKDGPVFRFDQVEPYFNVREF